MLMNSIKMSVLFLGLAMSGIVLSNEMQTCPETLSFTKTSLVGDETINLCERYLGKVVLVVNTASKCGYTYQYEGLEQLYKEYKDRGLVVLGFPSNDFGSQEPGSAKQIATFCRLTYSVQFPMFEKTRVVKPNADAFYKLLGELAGEYPAWNFHKYILDRNGKLIASFNSKVEPKSREILSVIEKFL